MLERGSFEACQEALVVMDPCWAGCGRRWVDGLPDAAACQANCPSYDYCVFAPRSLELEPPPPAPVIRDAPSAPAASASTSADGCRSSGGTASGASLAVLLAIGGVLLARRSRATR